MIHEIININVLKHSVISAIFFIAKHLHIIIFIIVFVSISVSRKKNTQKQKSDNIRMKGNDWRRQGINREGHCSPYQRLREYLLQRFLNVAFFERTALRAGKKTRQEFRIVCGPDFLLVRDNVECAVRVTRKIIAAIV